MKQPIAQIRRADLPQRILCDGNVGGCLEAQPALVGMPALQDEFPCAHRIQELAFLLHHGDALRAYPRFQAAGFEAVELHAARKRLEDPGDQLQQSGLSARVAPQDGHDLPLARLKGGSLERKHRSRVFAGGVGEAGLLDAQPDISGARRSRGAGGKSRARNRTHAALLRNK